MRRGRLSDLEYEAQRNAQFYDDNACPGCGLLLILCECPRVHTQPGKETRMSKSTETAAATAAPTAIATREDRQRGIEALSINGRSMTPEQVSLLKSQICKGASDDELRMFVAVCGRTGLDPFTKQIYWIMRYDSKQQREVGAIQIGIDGLRLIAMRTGKYAGQDQPQWCGKDGVWRDVWFDDGPPAAARVAVYRNDVERPTVGIARYSAYVQTYKDRQSGTKVPNSMWERMDAEQLAKCAEAQALRKAFPQDLANLYTDDEVREIHGPRDLRHSPGVALSAAKSSAEVIDKVLDEPETPASDAEPEHVDAEPEHVADPAAEPVDALTLEEFLATCATATKALGRTLVKEAPAKSKMFWFMDQEIISETLQPEEIAGSVLLKRVTDKGGMEQMVSPERMARLHAAVQARLEALTARTA